MPEVDVEHELRELGRALDAGTPSSALAEAVLERVAAEPVPARSGSAIAADRITCWVRGRLRWLVGLLAAVLGLGVVASPVGAEVAEWFGIGGIVVRTAPSSDDPPSGVPEVPEAPGDLALSRAAEEVGFIPAVPAVLGPPDRVAVVRDGTVLAMSWRDPEAGTLRLDQLEVEVAPYYWKTAPGADLVQVGAHDGLWIDQPHDLVLLDGSGRETTMPPRMAAMTLLWVDGERTFRLEGDLTLERAVEIAESVD